MEALTQTIQTTPIIDHHAHNLLLPSGISKLPLISFTTEADGDALKHTHSTLAHVRAVKQLAEVLGCEPKWDVIQGRVEEERRKPDDAWSRRCFQGIETVLIDDGLYDESEVQSYDWHDRLTRSKCKRILRIEALAEDIIFDRITKSKSPKETAFEDVTKAFVRAIHQALLDEEVVGFKSIIAYRSGLAIESSYITDANSERAFYDFVERNPTQFEDDSVQLEDAVLGSYFVQLVAHAIQINHGESEKPKKPFQFHTGLGDNSEDLRQCNPTLMREFIEAFPEVPIVLLHASYPYTKEAGYLATVYENVYLDIGEVFPMISQEGQESVIREALDLCPTEKLNWSTDGHSCPESYLLACIQVREALTHVLREKVARQSLTVGQAIKVVKDILFDTSNRLYVLNLSYSPLSNLPARLARSSKADNIALLTAFLKEHPSVKFLRVQWLDYTNTLRLRVLPIKQALELFAKGSHVSVFGGCFGLLQIDHLIPGQTAMGAKHLIPCFQSLRLGARPGHATVQGEFLDADTGNESAICPRTILRKVVERAKTSGIEFKIGVEVEVVFLGYSIENGQNIYDANPINRGQWSSSRTLQEEKVMSLLEEIAESLLEAGIELQQFHGETCAGQYEFVTGPLPPLSAADTLLATREIICAIAAKHDLRATFVPKPIVAHPLGTGLHTHLSMTPQDGYESFYAGILRHLRAITAFTQSSAASYERSKDGNWSGGTWVAWGEENRETPLRKVDGAHWEIRCVDGLANVYLALAAMLGAGYYGWMEDESLTIGKCNGSPAEMSDGERRELGIVQRMPKEIEEALEDLDGDSVLREILGNEAVDLYLKVKKAEVGLLRDMAEEERRNWLIDRY